MAGYSASIKLNNLVITSLGTIGNGISNFTAQNLGAGKISRIKEGWRSGVGLVWLISIPFSLVYFFAGRFLVCIFLNNQSGTAMQVGVEILHIIAPFYLLIAAKLATDGVLRGLGKMNRFMAATFTDLVLRVVLAFVLSEYLGATGIWIAWPIGWCFATLLSLIFYKTLGLDKIADNKS